MNDYFSALATRTLRPELGVRPRYRSQWEDSPERERTPLLEESAEPIVSAPPRTTSREEHRPPPSRVESVARGGHGRHTLTPTPHGDRHARPREEITNAAVTPVAHAQARTSAQTPGIPAAPTTERQQRAAAAIHPDAPARHRAGKPGEARAAEPVPHQPARVVARAAEAAPAEPSIRIHIGRVDVRAVMPATPAPPAARDQKSPLMSLDDYVQKRDRGIS